MAVVKNLRKTKKLGIIGCLVLILLGLSNLSVSADTLSQKDENKASALGDFGACLGAEHKGQLILLLDQSGSLQKTDPNKDRLIAAQYFVKQLTKYAAQNKSDIDLQVAGFADDYFPNDWTKINDANLNTINTQIKTIVDDLKIFDTDYPTALLKARAALADHRGKLPSRCQAIAWFTDGEYDLDVRKSGASSSANKVFAPDITLDSEENVKKVLELGKKELCRKGGIADQLRAEKVTLIGFGLNSDNKVDLSFFKNIISAHDCGNIKEPAGTFFESAKMNELLLAFDQASYPGTKPLRKKISTCPDDFCDAGAFEFTLDNSLSQVQVLTYSKTENIRPVVQTPSGKIIEITSENGDLTKFTGHSISFVLNPKKLGEWKGVWRLALVASAKDVKDEDSELSIMMVPSIEVALPKEFKHKLRAGEVNKDFILNLVNTQTGKNISVNELEGKLAVRAVAKDSKGKEFKLLDESTNAAEKLGKPLAADLTKAIPGAFQITLTSTYTTAPAKDKNGKEVAGTKLNSKTLTYDLNLLPAVGYPVLAPQVDFGTLEGILQKAGKIEVTGPGCVWLKSSKNTTKPQELADPKITSKYNSADNCLKLKDGEKQEFPVNLEINTVASGGLNGELQIAIAPLDELTRVLEIPTPYTANIVKPLNQKLAIISMILATLFGLLIPIILIYLAKGYSSRIAKKSYSIAKLSFFADQPVALPNVKDSDFELISGVGGKVFSAVGLSLRAKMALSPLAPAYVIADLPGGTFIGSHPNRQHQDKALLPIDITDSWVVGIDSSGNGQAWIILDAAVGGYAIHGNNLAKAAETAFNQYLREHPIADDSSNNADSMGLGAAPFGGAPGMASTSPSPFAGGGVPFGGTAAPSNAPFGGAPNPGSGSIPGNAPGAAPFGDNSASSAPFGQGSGNNPPFGNPPGSNGFPRR